MSAVATLGGRRCRRSTPDATRSTAGSGDAASPPAAVTSPVAVPGAGWRRAGELPSIFRAADLTPIVLLVSLLTAAALGRGPRPDPRAWQDADGRVPGRHARDGRPRGRSRPLGDACRTRSGSSCSRPLVVGAQGVLAPDIVVRAAPMVAAVSIVGDRRLDAARRGPARRRRGAMRPRPARPRRTRTGTTHEHARTHEPRTRTSPRARARTWRARHGGIRHTHLPPAGTTITWRSLFVLGLAGGLIPSTSALLILLGSIAAGRPGVRVRPGRRVRPRDGGRDGRHRRRPGARSRAARSRRCALAPRSRRRRTCPWPRPSSSSALGIYLTVQAVGDARRLIRPEYGVLPTSQGIA